jgi:hypothetical protein
MASFYAVLAIVVIVALFLIFRDDHDKSYNKSEKGDRKARETRSFSHTQGQPTKEQPKYQKDAPTGHKVGETSSAEGPKTEKKASGQSLKDQIIGEIEAALGQAKKEAEEPLKLFGEVMGMAKDAVNTAMKEAQKGWNATPSQPDVDEQFPDVEEVVVEDDDLDLSFLDNLDYSEDLEENTETFDVVGLRYHCTVHDCGKIVGVVKPEPENVHDSRAQAVIRNDGKLLGYIPRTQQDWYEDFNEENVPCPFVGEIELDRSSAQLIAEIKVIIPTSREYVEEELKDSLA